MKRLLAFFGFLILFVLPSTAQTVSYWFQGWQRKPDAQQAQEYFMQPGANITFTYQTNRVIINSVGGGGLFQLTGDVLGGFGVPVPTTLAVIGGGGVNTKITYDTKGRVTGSSAAVLASADFANQGTTTTLLHGNAAGNPSWGQVNLATDVTGTLPGVWLTTGNTGAGNFLGSTDNQALQFRVNNDQVGLFGTDDSVTIARTASASAAESVAIGFSASASAPDSVALGAVSKATGNSAIAMGVNSISGGVGSIAIGQSAGSGLGMGNGSAAIGNGPVAPGNDAVSIGFFTEAHGEGSVAIGYGSQSLGDFSFGAGLIGVANNIGSFVWSDSNASGNSDTAADQFIVGSSGGAHFYTSGNGLVVDEGSGVWAFLSNGTVRATSHIAAGGKMWATNGYVNETYATNATMLCTLTNHFYFINAAANTQPIIALPNASLAPKIIYRFSMTNETASFIITNRTGTQSIRDGKSFSYTNYGPGEVSLISDGAHWWLASKGKTEMPNASYSTQTNTTFASVTNSVTLQTTDHSGVSQGIFLDNSNWGANGVGSRIWITNRGDYMLTFSAMWAKTAGAASSCGIWMRKNGTDVANSATLMTVAQNTTNVMTVNIFAGVSVTSYFDFQGFSTDGNGILQSIAAITTPFNRPACPSIIVTVNKISD